jgi:hypothetical protein
MGNETGNVVYVGHDQEPCCDHRSADFLYYGEHWHLRNPDGSYGERLDPRKVSTAPTL